jgi:hypothetical protein
MSVCQDVGHSLIIKYSEHWYSLCSENNRTNVMMPSLRRLTQNQSKMFKLAVTMPDLSRLKQMTVYPLLILLSIYLLTAIGLTPGGSSTVHIYTQTVHRTTQLTTLVGRLSGIRTQNGQTNWERVRAAGLLCELYPGICLYNWGKSTENLSQGSQRVPVGAENNIQNRTFITKRIHKHNNKKYITSKIKQKYTKHTTIYSSQDGTAFHPDAA